MPASHSKLSPSPKFKKKTFLLLGYRHQHLIVQIYTLEFDAGKNSPSLKKMDIASGLPL